MAACFRYIVNDVSAAIDFYTRHLGFRVEMHPAPPFAEISRGDMHVYLTQPSQGGGGAPMPSGEQQTPGGWNRLHLIVENLDGMVATLRSAGCRFRNDVIQVSAASRSCWKIRREIWSSCFSRTRRNIVPPVRVPGSVTADSRVSPPKSK